MSVLIFLVLACAPDKDPETTSEAPSFPTLVLNEGVEAEIERIRTAHRIPGLGVVLVVRNKGIWAKGFGQVNIDSPRLVDAHTPFMLASISKTFVATAMLQEIGSGTFSLEDNINQHIPFIVDNPKLDGEEILLKHLVTHTSSISDNNALYGGLGGSGFYAEGDSTVPLGDFLSDFLVDGGSWYDADINWLSSIPGTEYDYSNVASALAGYIIETTTEIPLRAHSIEHVFNPLGMTNTGWHLSDFDDLSSVAMPHTLASGEAVPYGHYGYPDYPDGQLRASPNDLGRYMLAYLQDDSFNDTEFLSSDQIQQAFQPVLIDFPNTGVFWGIGNTEGERGAWHGGSDFGVSTDLTMALDSGIGIAVLANLSGSYEIYEGLYEIEALLFGEAKQIP